MRRFTLTLVLLTAFLLPTSVASAGSLDPSVAGLVSVADGLKFLSRDLGLAFQPRFGAPANTHGGAGFDMGYALTMTDIAQDSEHWSNAVEDPADLLLVSQFSIHKGLPYSIGLSTTLGFLHDSGLWSLDLGVKWAFVEGFHYVPDMAFHVQVGTLMGSSELSILRVATDFQISKSFGLGGVVRMTPYAAYSFTFVQPSPHVVAVFDEWAVEADTNIVTVLPLFLHRGILGVRVTAAMVDVGLEIALGDTHTFGTRVGINF
ncbi:MAG: hypothetical protein ACPGU1_04845 [Myxococcota bacterium]